MSRALPFRHKAPPIVTERLVAVETIRLLFLAKSGPTGYILKTEDDKKVTVMLGSTQTCSCASFTKERELCVHILWVMRRIMRLEASNPLLYQLSLTEREIEQLLTPKPPPKTEEDAIPAPSADSKLKARPIGPDDTCPICMDVLLESAEPTTFCKQGCKGSMHVKCLYEWATHAVTTGSDDIQCPLCREVMGSYDDIKTEYLTASKSASRVKNAMEKSSVHLGITCSSCHKSGFSGKCYRCKTCALYYLDQPCFIAGDHGGHAFEFRETQGGRWFDATRPQHTTTGLAGGIAQQLMGREITEEDYDLLLQLEQPSFGKTLTMAEIGKLAVTCVPCAEDRSNSPNRCGGYHAGIYSIRVAWIHGCCT